MPLCIYYGSNVFSRALLTGQTHCTVSYTLSGQIQAQKLCGKDCINIWAVKTVYYTNIYVRASCIGVKEFEQMERELDKAIREREREIGLSHKWVLLCSVSTHDEALCKNP